MGMEKKTILTINVDSELKEKFKSKCESERRSMKTIMEAFIRTYIDGECDIRYNNGNIKIIFNEKSKSE